MKLYKIEVTPKGLTNNGNTCFFNAPMQCLFSLDHFTKYLLTHNFNYNQHFVTSCVKDFLKEYTKSPSTYNPHRFILKIQQKIKLFDGAQQDTIDFFATLINTMIEEQSELKNLFDATIKETVKCMNCNALKGSEYPSTIQYLYIEKTISKSISNFIESCDTGSSYYCEKCKKEGDFSISREFVDTAEYFLIHLNRYNVDYTKNRKKINIEHKIRINDIPYKIVGVVCHGGCLSGGHYWAYAERKGKFCKFNDNYVEGVNDFVMNSDEPYLVFYQKVDMRPIDL